MTKSQIASTKTQIVMTKLKIVITKPTEVTTGPNEVMTISAVVRPKNNLVATNHTRVISKVQDYGKGEVL